MSISRYGRFWALRRIRAVGAILAVGILLAGCQGVPSSGPVVAGLADLEQTEQQVLFNPSKPVPGATQEGIVRGFVDAASSSTDDYAIARQFLAPDYVTQWDPSSGVFIYEGSRPYREAGDGIGVLSISAIAELDERGTLTPTPPGPTTDVRFELVKVGEEWRIISAPNGIILDRDTFSEVWAPHQLYFADAVGELVPDTRWFLSRATASTNIVAELIAGPAEPLGSVLRSGFPVGTVLVSDSVPVIDGTARIDLSREVETADDAERALISAQLSASLRTVRGIANFAISVDQLPGFAGGAVSGPQPTTRPKSQYTPLVLSEEGFGFLYNAGFESLAEIGGPVASLDPTAITVAPSGAPLAAVLGGGRATAVTPNELVPLDARPGLLAPAIDRYGYIWTSSSVAPQLVIATAVGLDPVSLAAPWLEGASLAELRVSPDGSRLSALVADGDRSVVLVAGILRDADGRPTGFTEGVSSSMLLLGSPLDLDWIDSTRFVALTQVGEVSRITIGGPGLFPTESGSVADGVSISGSGSGAQLRVLDTDGVLFAPQGSGWQRQASEIEVLSKRG